MSIGVFFESNSATWSKQVILVPFEHGVETWSREFITEATTKVRWKKEVPRFNTSDIVTRPPVAFVISGAMQRDLVDKGWSYSMPTVALAAHSRTSISLKADSTPDVVLTDFTSYLTVRDENARQCVNDILMDERRKKLVDITPLPSSFGAFSANNPVVVAAPAVVHHPVAVVQEPERLKEAPQEDWADSRSFALVLPPEYADKYVHRKVHGVEDFKIFDAALEDQDSVLLYGPTGSAKTTVAKAWAAKHGFPVAQISGTHTLEESRIFGKQLIRNNSTYWQNGVVSEVARDGGLILLDEIDVFPAGIQTGLFQALRERIIVLHDNRGEVIHLGSNVLIVGTMNGTRGYNRRQLDAAMKNRFAHNIEWDYDTAVERSLGVKPAVADLADKLRLQWSRDEISTPVPTNALLDLQRISKRLGLDYAIGNFVARFSAEEQPAVRLSLDAVKSNLAADLVSA
jgi:nitric oxide reductase NorQ protein